MGKRNPDELLQDGPKAAVELTESDLDQAAGGSVAKDKMVSANKNSAAIKALL
jgi:hypothetical protein